MLIDWVLVDVLFSLPSKEIFRESRKKFFVFVFHILKKCLSAFSLNLAWFSWLSYITWFHFNIISSFWLSGWWIKVKVQFFGGEFQRFSVCQGEQNFYTVVFAVSRTLGVMAQYIWSRAVTRAALRTCPRTFLREFSSTCLFEKSRLSKNHELWLWCNEILRSRHWSSAVLKLMWTSVNPESCNLGLKG